jgi:hypothetical protein
VRHRRNRQPGPIAVGTRADREKDGGLDRPSRTGWNRSRFMRRVHTRLPEARHHGPRRRIPTLLNRTEFGVVGVQRPDLQRPRTPPAPGGPGPPSSNRHRHGGHPPCVRAIGPRFRQPTVGHVRHRAVGRTCPKAHPGPGPSRGKAPVLLEIRQRTRVRFRDSGASNAPRLSRCVGSRRHPPIPAPRLLPGSVHADLRNQKAPGRSRPGFRSTRDDNAVLLGSERLLRILQPPGCP